MEAENEELLFQFGRMKKVLEMMVVMVAEQCGCTDATELYT